MKIKGLLAITGKEGDMIELGDDIVIIIQKADFKSFKVYIKAPKEVKIKHASVKDTKAVSKDARLRSYTDRRNR